MTKSIYTKNELFFRDYFIPFNLIFIRRKSYLVKRAIWIEITK